MKIAICDDDKKCNKLLINMLVYYMERKKIDKYEISEYTSGITLLKDYVPESFDFIFLDIDMPQLSGFDTAKRIRELDLSVDIVFVTYLKDDKYQGYDYNAKGYLLKNVTQEQIDNRMDKLIDERLRSKAGAFRKIKIKNKGTALLSLARTLYFESKNHDISAISETEEYVFLDSITNLATELADRGFVQISQTHLVNIEHVFYIKGYRAILKNAKKDLVIGRSYKQALIDAFESLEANKWKI